MSVGSASADVIRNNQSQAEIFKLKIDHFEELFDWLSLNDLVALSRTCKRMQRIVGYYIKTTYAAIKFNCTSDGIERGYQESKLTGLSSFLKKLMFHYLEYVPFDHWNQQWGKPEQIIPHMVADQFKSLTEILLTRVVLTDAGISRIKGILGQLEMVRLKFPHFLDEKNKDIYGDFLKYCTNVKELCIQGSSNRCLVGVDNSWLLREYPTLEHFELIMNQNGPIDELSTFFGQNNHFKRFATNVEMILANSDTFKTTPAKWDVLSVEFCHTNTFIPSRDLLNKLYERGRFNEVHVYFFTLFNTTFDQESVNELTSFKGLTKLYIDGMEDGTDLSRLITLKQLYISRASSIANTITLATKLFNLEFIHFTYADVSDIVPFICQSPKLTKIVVFRLKENDEHILNLVQLNKERSKLPNARKVTIHVEEHVYLDVKWTKKQTNLSLIEIKRGSSYDTLNHSFDYMDNPDRKF
ncbi:uncharacterized protein LOC129568933 [Sitodiplosis mosellana]|uniref:uncharacterized protein LOC129568933 n=1 Tax=Sitodiplosis mosellana TaxID=263140 RepID=UPI0024444488|nr:uncharacterized protein LOC129568933 [Sitodiplosis mosellana]